MRFVMFMGIKTRSANRNSQITSIVAQVMLFVNSFMVILAVLASFLFGSFLLYSYLELMEAVEGVGRRTYRYCCKKGRRRKY